MPAYSMFCVHYPENNGHYRYLDESADPDVLGGALTQVMGVVVNQNWLLTYFRLCFCCKLIA